jgi:hypothetical protein
MKILSKKIYIINNNNNRYNNNKIQKMNNKFILRVIKICLFKVNYLHSNLVNNKHNNNNLVNYIRSSSFNNKRNNLLNNSSFSINSIMKN